MVMVQMVQPGADSNTSRAERASPRWADARSYASLVGRFAAVSVLAAAAYMVAIGIPNPLYVRLTTVTTSNLAS